MTDKTNESHGIGNLIISNVTAMSIFGILNTSFVVAYASLIFSSTCPEYFVTGVALFLLAGCIVSIILASLSSYPGVIAMIQDVPVAISGLIAVSLAQVLTNANPDALFANIFAAIAISTLLSGISFVLLGHFKLGNLVRFIPFPVMGGFLAATGWLLFKGGLQVSTGSSFQLLQLGSFFQGIDYYQLICAVTFAVGLMVLSRRFPSSMVVMPGSIVGTIIVFMIVARILGYSIGELESQGWLLGPLPDQPLWRSAALPDFSLIDWPLVLKQIASIATIVVLSVISFLLNTSGVEFIVGKDLDINKDLKSTGIANLISGFAGAPSSYLFISQTALATRIGAKERSVGIFHGVFLLAVFFIGGAFLSFFPKFVAGGLPLYLGISMLWEWLLDVRKSMPKVDYSIIIGILLIVEFWGFLQGIGIGIVASVVIFVFRYSSINIVKNELDGSGCKSAKDRPITDQRLLDYNSEQMLVLQLQGFIFFGTANSLYEKIKNAVSTAERSAEFVLIDMALVQGIDSSAVKSLEKLTRYLQNQDIEMGIVNSGEQVKATLEANGMTESAYQRLHYFDDLDRATEWCEDVIIGKEKARIEKAKLEGQEAGGELLQAVYKDMMAALEMQVKFENLVDGMKHHLEKMNVTSGDYLYRQGDVSEDLFFIMRGQVTLTRTNREGMNIRARTLGPWTLTGEVGSFLGYHSPYDAVVESEGLIYKLSAKNRKQIELDDPKLSAELQKLIITTLGAQLMKN